MNWIVFLRRCLLARLIDPQFGGLLKIIFGFDGDLAEAETVLPAYAYEVLKHYVGGSANIAELVKAVNGDDEIQKVVLDGYAIMNKTFVVEGDIEFMLDLIAKLETAEITRRGESMIAICVPISAYVSSNDEVTDTTGDLPLPSFDTDGLLVIAYQYTTEENDAGGTTYNIMSEYYSEDGSTVYIGG